MTPASGEYRERRLEIDVDAKRSRSQPGAHLDHRRAERPARDALHRLRPREPQRSGQDLARSALAIARMEAQIARNIDEYNKRPRKQFVGARTAEYRFAQYVEDWRQKIEQIGNLNYPEAARGKLYGSLIVSVEINADGSVASAEVSRPSGKNILDQAALRIVRLAAPFAPFPPGIRRETDVISITRTWSFTQANQLQAN